MYARLKSRLAAAGYATGLGDEGIDRKVGNSAAGRRSSRLKSGAPARGERVAKYNRLLELAEAHPTSRVRNSQPCRPLPRLARLPVRSTPLVIKAVAVQRGWGGSGDGGSLGALFGAVAACSPFRANPPL
ncbi:hypothetical protein [Streptomyces triticagri]|uniref:hypothetical protein n=1 Tax=Streptomyces triticagri TaxID=2293568 RepID=UPI001F331E1D